MPSTDYHRLLRQKVITQLTRNLFAIAKFLLLLQ